MLGRRVKVKDTFLIALILYIITRLLNINFDIIGGTLFFILIVSIVFKLVVKITKYIIGFFKA